MILDLAVRGLLVPQDPNDEPASELLKKIAYEKAKLIKEGKIKSVDEPICNYYPEYKEGERSKITFKHLLQMSSGLNYYDTYKNPFGTSGKIYYGTDVRKVTNQLQSEKEAGIEWRYKNCDPQVLGLCGTLR